MEMSLSIVMVSGQLADCQLTDWTSCGLDSSRTSQVVVWSTRELVNSRMMPVAENYTTFC